MTLKRRIANLEGHAGTEVTVFGNTPVYETTQQAETALREAAIAQGIKPPFGTFPVQQHNRIEVEVTGIGSMAELFDHVAKHGGKLGRQEEQQA